MPNSDFIYFMIFQLEQNNKPYLDGHKEKIFRQILAQINVKNCTYTWKQPDAF